MILNVLKGAYPSLQQISKDLLIAADAVFERGSVLVMDTTTSGTDSITTWKVSEAGDSAKAVPAYFALQDHNDYQAKMAGTLSSTAGYAPKVSALDCRMTMEIETDMFDGDVKPGDYLMVGAGGKLVKHTTGKTAVLQVTAAPYVRWCNNADAAGEPNFRQGTNVTVIRGTTVFLPGLA